MSIHGHFVISTAVSGNQGTPLEMKDPPSVRDYLLPGWLTGKTPFHFYPVSSPDTDGTPPVENAPGMSPRLIDLSVRRAAFTYPPTPPLPLAHTMVPSSQSAGGYPTRRRSGGPSNQGTRFTDCDPSSLILPLSPG